MKVTMTSDLRTILKNIGKTNSGAVFSDIRSNDKLGIKFCGVYLNKTETEYVEDRMNGLGYKSFSIKVNEDPRSYKWYWGTRFTFYKKGLALK